MIDPADAEADRIRTVYAKRQDGVRYSWFNPGHTYMMVQRERRVLDLLGRHGFAELDSKKILDVGCGIGQWILDFIKWGARPENITGTDLLADRIARAKHNCPAGATLLVANAARMTFPDESFDLVVQSTVFTSILDQAVRREVAAQMFRVLKPDGLILWYDYYLDNPRNPNVRAATRREIRRLFPSATIELHRVTLAPPLARFLAPYSWALCYLLEQLPLLRTHYLGAIRKRHLLRNGST